MTSDTSFIPLDGGCECGAVRFRIESAPIITHCCHCRLCQAATGSAFALNTMIETDRLTVLQGAPAEAPGLRGWTSVQCPACATGVWSHHPQLGKAIAFVGVGLLDEGERLPPEAHYFTRSKHPWVTLPPGVVAFEQLGDPGKAEAGPRIMAALAAAGGGRALQDYTGGPAET